MDFKSLTYQAKQLLSSRLFKNSFWGIAANGIQTILLSLFFVITARKYSTSEFGLFLIATSLYQFLAAFSTLGLGQWFTREIVHAKEREQIVLRFLKIQFFSGTLFYFVNVALAFLLYKDSTIHLLALILGLNIIFDNSIYAIRALNVAEYQQKKSFIILCIDSALKFGVSCILFVYPLHIIWLSVLLIIIRFITLNFFISFGSSDSISLKGLWKTKIALQQVKEIVLKNWAFIIIGSVSIIFWRIGNFIISKKLSLADVSNYEVSFRVFSIALILPLIISTSIFPSLVSLYNEGNKKKLSQRFHSLFLLYYLYGFVTYTFFYSFSDWLMPFAFGEQYLNNAMYTKQMFLTILVFPTALLQANILVAIRMEKADMWLNIVSLVTSILFCVIGLHFSKSLSVVNYAIFFSFLLFHLLQDILLIRKKIISLLHVVLFYIISISAWGLYLFLATKTKGIWLFPLFWIVTGGIILLTVLRKRKAGQFFTNQPHAN